MLESPLTVGERKKFEFDGSAEFVVPVSCGTAVVRITVLKTVVLRTVTRSLSVSVYLPLSLSLVRAPITIVERLELRLSLSRSLSLSLYLSLSAPRCAQDCCTQD
jgi:hypothetical protein